MLYNILYLYCFCTLVFDWLLFSRFDTLRCFYYRIYYRLTVYYVIY